MDSLGEGPLGGVWKLFDILPDPGDEIYHRVVRGQPFVLGAILRLQYHDAVEVVVVLDGQRGLRDRFELINPAVCRQREIEMTVLDTYDRIWPHCFTI